MEILRNVEAVPTWDAGELKRVLALVRDALPDVRFDWDLDAGEEWVSVLYTDELDALIRAPTSVTRSHRFAFVRSGSAAIEVLQAILSTHEADIVEVADFEEPSLSIRAGSLATFVGRNLPPAHVFDLDRFSANDLWFVSI